MLGPDRIVTGWALLFREHPMRTTACFALVAWMLLGLGVGEAGAQGPVARFRVASGSTVIVISDEALGRLLINRDRLFLCLGIQQDCLRQRNPLNQVNPFQPLVIEAQRFGGEGIELDGIIERLGRLIREAEREKGEK